MPSENQRVCVQCGEAVGEQRFCGSCGFNLSQQEDLPTRAEWEATAQMQQGAASRAQGQGGASSHADAPPARTKRPKVIAGAVLIGVAVILGIVLAAGGEKASQSSPDTLTQPTATTGEALPSKDARGFIEGPSEYTDHGMRIRLNAEQAAKPMEQHNHLYDIEVHPLAFAQAAGEPTAEERTRANGFLVTFAASGFSFTTKPPLLTCASQNVEGLAAALGQTCTLQGESGNLYWAEVFDEATHILIYTGVHVPQATLATPQTLYGEMIALLPGIRTEAPATTTVPTETETTPTTSSPETSTTEPPASSSPNETACGDFSPYLTRVRATGVSCSSAMAFAKRARDPVYCWPNNETVRTASCVWLGYQCRTQWVKAEIDEMVCKRGATSIRLLTNWAGAKLAERKGAE